MIERQKDGIAKAKAKGKYKGRVPTARRQSDDVIKLHGQGLKPSEIGNELGMSRTSVWRIVKTHREANGWETEAAA
jgi:DNA invertase Pin-like site-specific DNA recombinase